MDVCVDGIRAIYAHTRAAVWCRPSSVTAGDYYYYYYYSFPHHAVHEAHTHAPVTHGLHAGAAHALATHARGARQSCSVRVFRLLLRLLRLLLPSASSSSITQSSAFWLFFFSLRAFLRARPSPTPPLQWPPTTAAADRWLYTRYQNNSSIQSEVLGTSVYRTRLKKFRIFIPLKNLFFTERNVCVNNTPIQFYSAKN